VAIDDREIDSAGAAALSFRDLNRHPRDAEFEFEGPHQGRRVLVHAHEPAAHSLPVHPTQIYSAVDAFILCLLLLAADPYIRRDGQLFALGIGLHAVARFLLEIIRVDESAVFGTGLSISQNISVLLLLAAVAIFLYSLRHPGRAFWGRVWQAREATV
jgi:prolipoprotein diacylglyceryltransferase